MSTRIDNQLDLMGELPQPGSKWRHKSTELVATVLYPSQRRYCWIVIRAPIWVDWPENGWVDSESEVRLDRFRAEFEPVT